MKTKAISIKVYSSGKVPKCTDLAVWLLWLHFWLTVLVNWSISTQNMAFVLESSPQKRLSAIHWDPKHPFSRQLASKDFLLAYIHIWAVVSGGYPTARLLPGVFPPTMDCNLEAKWTWSTSKLLWSVFYHSNRNQTRKITYAKGRKCRIYRV